MKIIRADFIFLCDENFTILQDSAVLFDETIIKISNTKTLQNEFKNATFIDLGKNSILMPGLINIHTHFEFSSNRSMLEFGSFIPWLKSVIKNRDFLMTNPQKNMQKALNEAMQSGVTTFGAISSNALDLDILSKSKARIIFFNEILGSNPASVDFLYGDFLSRLENSKQVASNRFIPAISVHSPYSTHPILAKKALQIAKKDDLFVSTHFMESKAERDWLERSDGEFLDFFSSFNPNSKALINPKDYIELFADTKAIFTHCCYANDEELNLIKKHNFFITHCAKSNRLLGSKKLDLKNIFSKNIFLTLGTDGLSSNDTLNIFDELKTALILHENFDIHELSKQLLKALTINANRFLDLNIGTISEGKNADFATFKLEQIPEKIEHLPLSFILFAKKAQKIFIQGEEVAIF